MIVPASALQPERALAYTRTAELLDLPFLAADKVGDSGAAYTLAKRANALRAQAAATTWGRARGTGELPEPRWPRTKCPVRSTKATAT
jgi:hypothetical protein